MEKKSGWYCYKQTSPPKPNGYLHYQLIEYSKCPRENGSTWNSLEHLTAGGAVVNCILRGSCRRRERGEGHEGRGGGWSGTFSVLHITSLQSHISSTYSDIWHCVNDIVCMADADGSFFFFFFLLTASLTNLGSHRLHVNAIFPLIAMKQIMGTFVYCSQLSPRGKHRGWSISSVHLTFFIKPYCIITAGVGGVLHCCLISQLMLLLAAANPSFVLLKQPLSSCYQGETEFVIYYEWSKTHSGCVHRLLNPNKVQFQLLERVVRLLFPVRFCRVVVTSGNLFI